MPAASPSRSATSTRRRPRGNRPASRFDQRLSELLAHATDVFDEKGYEGASMRDLSRASGMSLAGLYYYFESKEKLLYLIQRHAFTTILERLRSRLEGVNDPEARIRVFIANHLEYFLANQKAMKVLSHEDEVLKNGYGAEIAGIKREYVRSCVDLMDDLKKVKGLEFSSRTAALSLFGMMNWIYTWYKARVDGDASDLAREMGNIFLNGLSGRQKRKNKGTE
jgi:AcrR family transcriptional regulator